jgi:very-short-patch-repair endonuclease
LWGYLRKRSLAGFRFNRQTPIGPFIVDFICRERRLIIEVDGVTHGEPGEVKYDLWRTQYLRSCGYAVHRADNVDAFTNIEGVMDSILWALHERPASFAKNPPSPSDNSPYK